MSFTGIKDIRPITRFYQLTISAPDFNYIKKVFIPCIEEEFKVKVMQASEWNASNNWCYNCGEAIRKNETMKTLKLYPNDHYYCSKPLCRATYEYESMKQYNEEQTTK